jgi:FkbM family methyltransferase
MMAKKGSFSSRVTMDDVASAYRLFLRRPQEEASLEHYQGLVAKGMPIERLTSAFLASDEFNSLQTSRLVAVDLGGYSVVVDRHETEFAPAILVSRDYKPHVRRIIARRFREGQTLVDLGAGAGCISFLAAKIAGPSGQVVALEPNPTNQQRLYAGIVLNELDNIHVLPYAVSDRRMTCSLNGGVLSTRLTPAVGIDVPTVYAQTIVPDEALAYLPSIHFIKLDVKGHETEILRGFSTLIRRHNPTLLFDFNPSSGHDPMDFLYKLFELFNHAVVTTAHGDSFECSDPHELMDYWQKRNAELSADGILSDGSLHFDVIATNR